MKRLSRLAGLLAVAGAMWGADLSGGWRGGVDLGGRAGGVTLILEQRGPELSGTVRFDGDRPRPIEKPTLNQDLLVFAIHDGQGRLVRFRLALSDARLTGEVTLGDQVSKIQMHSLSVDAPLPVSGQLSRPVAIYIAQPEFTDEARKARLQGTVVLSVQVTAEGKVTNVKVVRGLGMGLDEKAVECAQKWKFKPAFRASQPVATFATIEVNFRPL